jgi:hypothetical protein
MWIVSDLKIEPRSFSFESSGQGPHLDIALLADGLELVNMVEAVNWGEDPVQVVVCDHCGCVKCQHGNWVSVRRLDDWVLMVASVKGYGSTDAFTREELSAPRWLRIKGAPLIPVADWERARAHGAALPPSSGLRDLNWHEALLEAQIEAPRHMLGEPGRRQEMRLSTLVSATDPWMDPKLLDMVGDLTAWTTEPNVRAVVHRAPETKLVSLFMEDGLQEEVLLGLHGGELGVYFKPDLVLFPVVAAV